MPETGEASGPEDSSGAEPIGPYPEKSEQQALAEVSKKLKHLATSDPEGHAQLLDQLTVADPSIWAMTVDRAIATAEYRKQLASTGASKVSPQVSEAEAPEPSRVAVSEAADKPKPELIRTAAIEPPQSDESRVIQLASVVPDTPEPPVQAIHEVDLQDTTHRETQPSESTQSEIRLVGAELPAQRTEKKATDSPRRLPEDWRSSLDETIDLLSQDVKRSPQNAEQAYRHARLRLLQLAAGQRSPAVASVPGLPSSEQAYWSQQLFAMSTMLDSNNMPDRSRRAAAAGHYQGEATAQLGHIASLSARNLTFCEEIYGYGAYEPIDEPLFRPGDEARLYVEVENYRSQSTERGLHTSLATSYRFLDKSGQVVDQGDFPTVDDYCLAIRRDFHIQYRVPMPTAIYPGEYELEITVNDQLGDKIGRASVRFEIAGE